MIQIGDVIVSTDILRCKFCCDLSRCRGICCVDGNSGAPLEIEEVELLEQEWDSYKEYMTPEGIAAVEKEGFMIIDEDGDLTTPLVNDAECAYSVEIDGSWWCAIERAWFEGKTKFRKPVSCHLYPIRVAKFSNGTVGLNYHRWNICADAVKLGKDKGIPIYKCVKDAIIRHFGEEFYKQLEIAEELLNESEK